MVEQKQNLINHLLKQTKKGNVDNISRTIFYENFYTEHPEIRWALLAGMVSRNAGWNMTDLESKWFQQLVEKTERAVIFSTYERANWLIFADAYPQLVLYEYSKKRGKPYFHLLSEIGVSKFMEYEWRMFWEKRDEIRLCTAQIINEQYVIQKPVIENTFYQTKVFNTVGYFLEEHAHFSYVLFPTRRGELYGYYVRKFRDVSKRIWLGKKLAALLFNPTLFEQFIDFHKKVEPTGSRNDYARFLNWKTKNTSPMLRLTLPIFEHDHYLSEDWLIHAKGNLKHLFNPIECDIPNERTEWLRLKQLELYYSVKVKAWLSMKKTTSK
ncbi:DUF2515 family protein [Bacillus solitudinis]|uniref:DUF2515 family protein n=1 Tax=Bacillus solitudinis TaxID=2014074 RepID=UPI000C23F158|nr:DUF2515 family protein [Bacillus solitudinis]